MDHKNQAWETLTSLHGKPPSREPVSLPTQTQYRAKSFMMVGSLGIDFQSTWSGMPADVDIGTLATDARGRGARRNITYLPMAALAANILALTASRLKLAPFCIGGNSIAVMASFST
jgi:hypothetical protein